MTQILLVDDNETNRYMLESMLHASGYTTISAGDGQAALELARRNPPDLVISDVLMPVMDGFSFCRAWQLDEQLRSIPFLFYTATYTDLKDQEFGFNIGATAYLVKPEEPEVLLAKIREMIASRNPTTAPPQPKIIEDNVFLKEYNYSLIQKLERKMLQLEEANRELELENKERRNTEVQLRQQTRLLDMASDAIICLGLDGVIRYWNRGAERVFGWSEMESNTQSWDVLFGPLPAPIQAAILRATSSEWAGELTLTTKDKQSVIVDSRWTLLTDERANLQHLLVVCTDVTQKKALEAQTLRGQRMEVIGTMASGIAHDLNNILTPIVVATPMLRRKMQGNIDDDLFRVIESSAERATAVLKQLLSFGRGMKGEREVVSIEVLFAELIGLMTQTFPRNVKVSSRIAPSTPPVLGDVNQLHQLLLNLCINARDAMPKGGSLKLSAELADTIPPSIDMPLDRKKRRYLKITVADSGSGISPENLPKIFDPFFTTKEIGVGTGLGLATVQSIAKSHGGTVVVTSEVNQGSQFVVYLPAVADDRMTLIDTPTYTPTETSIKIPKERPLTREILVVDDDPAICEIVRALLEYRGYKVQVASDATEAQRVACVDRDNISLILADITMPQLDGISLFRALRESGISTPIVAMSGLRDESQEAILASLGVRQFLLKPFTGEELLQSLESCWATEARLSRLTPALQ